VLTFRQLDDLPGAVISSMAGVERSILDDMARRLSKAGAITDTALLQAERLADIGLEREYIIEQLSAATNKTVAQIQELLDEACTRSLGADNAIFRRNGLTPLALSENIYLQQIIRAGMVKTMGAFANITRTTANTATQQFERALDLLHNEIVFGGSDYRSAIKRAVKSLTQDGLGSIQYPSGRVDSLDVAVRRAALTGVNQTAAEVQLANMSMLGANFVETTAHAGARPEHATWQGQIFQLSGRGRYKNFYDETGYGTGEGLCGWNCRHNFFPFFEGDSRAYNYDTLRDYNSRTVSYNGESMSLYDATQQQRNIERQIRRWKREESAMLTADLGAGQARQKVREWQARQRDFIDQTGLRRDYFRERAGKQNVA